MKMRLCTTLVALALPMVAYSEESKPASSQKERKTYILPETAKQRRVWVSYKNGEHDTMMQSLNSFAIQTVDGSASPPLELHYDFANSSTFVLTATESEIKSLELNPMVDMVVDDPERYPMFLPDSVQRRHLTAGIPQELPYGIRMVQADQAWSAGVTGRNVKVCVLDTGIDQGHEDFEPSALTGLQAGSNWRTDGVGHGTHVSGTIAAADNGVGVVGVAPDAEIYTVKVFGDNGRFVYASGLVDAANKCKDAGANIVSMSLGGGLWNPFEFRAYQRLFEEGVLTIAAAGNSGTGGFSYPASYEGVISVGAVDENKELARFSQRNRRVDIAAPGVDVMSTFPMSGSCQICRELGVQAYGTISGTSMATPHVSGVAALLWSFDPGASPQEIKDAMESSAEDLGSQGRDDSYGFGLVKAMAALEALNGGPIEGGGDSGGEQDGNDGACEKEGLLIRIELTTDGYADETYWEVARDEDSFPVLSGAGLADRTTYTKTTCLPSDCYTFMILDSRDDGICCDFGEGTLTLTVDGEILASGGEFGAMSSVSFGVCNTDPPVSKDPDPICVDLELNVLTDAYPNENRVVLQDVTTGDFIWNLADLSGNAVSAFDTCIDPAGCYKFEISDTYGDGLCCAYGNGSFELVLDGTTVAQGSDFGANYTSYIGDCSS